MPHTLLPVSPLCRPSAASDCAEPRRRRDHSMQYGPPANIDLLGVIGLLQDSDQIIGISFDILSLEALFLVPRYVVLLRPRRMLEGRY